MLSIGSPKALPCKRFHMEVVSSRSRPAEIRVDRENANNATVLDGVTLVVRPLLDLGLGR